MSNIIEEKYSDEVMKDFIFETGELIDQAYEDLLGVESGSDWEEKVNRLYRTFHTIKGTSSFLDLEKSTILAHVIENLINKIHQFKIRPDNEIMDIFFNVLEWYKNLIDAVINQTEYDGDIANIIERVEQFSINENEVSSEIQPVREEIISTTKPDTTQIKNVDTFRIGIEKLDTIIGLASELLLEKNKLLSLIRRFHKDKSYIKERQILENLYISLGYISTEIQDIITQVRLVPIAQLFKKYTRLVQVLSRMSSKSIGLEIGKENPKVDRSLTDIIDNLLIHLIRNAVDHGIEVPEVRLKKGKPEKGTIYLSACQNGSHITLEIQDDGIGINPKKILKIAIHDGIISPEKAQKMTRKEIINLIFKPGFSTASQVSEISGRGIGMDVVQNCVRKLNGTIDIVTNNNKGTKFIITFPVTLKILSGLTLKESDEYFIIPSFSFYDMLKLSNCLIKKANSHTVFLYKGSPVPLYFLKDLLDIPGSRGQSDAKFVIILAAAEKRIGLAVSDIFFQEETVVKTAETHSERTPFITGTTVRSNGQIALILDIQRLVDFSDQKQLVN